MKKGKIRLTKWEMAFGIVLLFQVLVIVFWGNKRENLYWDEYYSLQNAHYISYEQGRDVYIVDDKTVTFDYWIDSSETKAIFEVNTEDKIVNKGLLFVIKKAFEARPYRVLLNVWEGIWNFDNDICSAISLNIIFFVLTQLVLWEIAFLITNNNLISLLCIVFYGFSAIAINVGIFIRMYMLLTFICSLFALLHLLMLKQDNSLLFVICECMSFLFMYLGMKDSEIVAIYCGMISIGTVVVLTCRKKWKYLIIYMLPILGGGLFFAIYKKGWIVSAINQFRGITIADQKKLDGYVKWTVKASVLTGKMLFGNVRVLICVVVVFAFMGLLLPLRKKKISFDKLSPSFFVLLIGNVLFFACGIFMHFYDTFRYSSMGFPILAANVVIVGYLLCISIGFNTNKVILCILFVLYGLSQYITFSNPNIENIYPGDSAILEKARGNDVYVDSYFVWTVNEATYNVSPNRRIYYRKDKEADFVSFPSCFIMWASALDNNYLQSLDKIKRAGYSVDSFGQTYMSFVFKCSK